MRFHPNHISKWGIDGVAVFQLDGYELVDDVQWMWPWMRGENGWPWISWGFDCTFLSLSEMHNEWVGYQAAQRNVSRTVE